MKTCFLLVQFLLIYHFLSANNGTITYAYPMSSITVDGDLSDWPNDLIVYEINQFAFGSPLSENDLEASFRVGYNQSVGKLFLAVEVTDDSFVGDTTPQAEWNTHDIHNFYIDLIHDQRGSGAISHLISPDYRRIAENRPNDSWDPQVWNADWSPVSVEIKRRDNSITYEWSYELGDALKPGRSIGFDYEVIDKDHDDEGSPSVITWSPGAGKSFHTGNVGDLILVPEKNALYNLTGQIKWAGEDTLQIPRRCKIQSQDKNDLWLILNLDSTGNYRVDIPAGRYKLSMHHPVFYQSDRYVRIDDNETLEVLVDAEKSEAPTLYILSKPLPDLIPKKGIFTGGEKSFAGRVDNFMDVFMDYFEVPGASLALIDGGEVVHHQVYGFQNAFTRDKVTKNTLFEAASITKPVFAYIVCRLVERQEFDLDKPLFEYLPFPEIEEDERYKLMTGRHILTHTSGLPNWGRRLERKPGTEYGYSGEGFEYLKRAIVHTLDTDIETLIEQELLDPLEMTNTYFSRSKKLAEISSHGHFDAHPTMKNIPLEAGMAHSMHTEALDFSKFMIALLDRKGLKSETFHKMFSIWTETPNHSYAEAIGYKEDFGLGIVVAETPLGKAYGHGGNNGDFRCQFEVFDHGKKGFVLFTNGSNGHKLVQALREFLIVGKHDF